MSYRAPKPVEARIEDGIERVTESGCWIWVRGADRDGYGKITINYKDVRAHRAAYENYVGLIPEGVCVLHRCDVRECVNPDHLFLGTHQDNMTDMKVKGRNKGSKRFGEANPNAKLTKEQVLSIRESDLTQKELPEKYGVSAATINGIKSGERWSHIK